MARLRVLDLFSGIGGFSLGLEATGGFEVVAHCEIEPFCQEILHRYWPHVKLYKDIKELNYGQLETDGLISKQGDIDLICGGYPCQPFSVAGRKGGEADPRHLWPEYFRLIRELRPRYAVGENVGGHIRLGLDSVLEDLDSENYTARCFSVEAACIGAPHRRERIFWIAENMAHTESFERGSRQKSGQSKRNASGKCTGNGSSHVPHTESERHGRGIGEECGTGEWKIQSQEQEGREMGSKTQRCRQSLRTGAREAEATDVGNTECNGSSAPEIRGGNEETTGRTPQGTIQTFKPTGTGGFGDNETMADADNTRDRTPQRGTNGDGQAQDERRQRQSQSGVSGSSAAVPDPSGTRSKARLSTPGHGQKGYAEELDDNRDRCGRRARDNESPVESWVGDGTYGISAWLDGSWEHGLDRVGVNIPQRKAQLMALGNAVVPQLVALVGHAILENHDTIVSETEVKNERV